MSTIVTLYLYVKTISRYNVIINLKEKEMYDFKIGGQTENDVLKTLKESNTFFFKANTFFQNCFDQTYLHIYLADTDRAKEDLERKHISIWLHKLEVIGSDESKMLHKHCSGGTVYRATYTEVSSWNNGRPTGRRLKIKEREIEFFRIDAESIYCAII